MSFIIRPIALFNQIKGISVKTLQSRAKLSSSPRNLKDSGTRSPDSDLKLHTTTNFEKKILVFAKRYKSIKDVPDKVSLDVMHAATSRARIRLANIIMIISGLVFLVTALVRRSKKSGILEELKAEQDKIRREMIAEYTSSSSQGTAQK